MVVYKIAQSKIHLWLDDNRDPKDPINQQKYGAIGDELWVKTVEEAIPYIQSGKVESISFDNDLGEGIKEGRHLANWIEDAAYWNQIPPMKWHIHSENSEARPRIMAAMRNADRFWEEHRQENQTLIPPAKSTTIEEKL